MQPVVIILMILVVAISAAAVLVLSPPKSQSSPSKIAAAAGSTSSFSGTGQKGNATLTAYNIMSSDNTAKGALAEWKVTKAFTDKVNVVAVHQRDWPKMKYHKVRIGMKGKTGDFVVADYCADKDCGGCCTKNAAKFGNKMLLDMDAAAIQRIWGIKGAEKFLTEKGTYEIGDVVNVRTDWPKMGAKWDG